MKALFLSTALLVATGASAQGMDHGAMSMPMQGGSAPADARDPDAYSDGYRMAGDMQHDDMMMADQRSFGSLLVDRLERSGNTTRYDARGTYGTAYDKLVVKAEGEGSKGKVTDARTELLWGHAIGSYWDAQAGLRNDAGSGRPGRNWLALGVQGLSPYWFEVEATAYLGEGGRTALRLSGEYELLITQRLILQPRVETEFRGRDDPEAHTGNGLSTAAAGLRLRYEFNRQFAPYIGVERAGSFGNTAAYARAAGEQARRTRWVAGVRFWF